MPNKTSSSSQKIEPQIHPKYRADIDGLRAVAILSVLGFHAFPNFFRGGFIGVDIFFVISGFLISTIIFENLNGGRFNFLDFYVRRIKRIFPALLVVLFTCLIFGWFALLADEYKQLGKHISAGAGFISNFLLLAESGYFDNAAESKPLLHLWSLGIEEQFYFIWPLLLWLGWKQKNHLLKIVATIAIASFALNIFFVSSDPVASFYSPQTRFWELLIGSCLAYLILFKQHSLRLMRINDGNIPAVVGGILLTVGLLFVNRERAFPGWWALMPTMGAALIIASGSQAWLNRVVLSNRILVWFGLISFPLYLWHWPLLTFVRIVNAGTPSREVRAIAILVSIALAWLTYKLIEKPIRFGSNSNKKTGVLVSLMIFIGTVGFFCFMQSGFQGTGYRSAEKSAFSNYFENSLPDWKYFETTGIPEKFRDDCNFYDMPSYRAGKATQKPLNQINQSCYQRNSDKGKAVFLWGDSHAQQYYYGLNNSLPNDWQLLIVASSGCAAKAGILDGSKTNYCDNSNWFALKAINEAKPDVVIIAQDSGHNYDDMRKISAALKVVGVNKIVFMGASPHWTGTLPSIIMRRLWENTPERTFVGVDEAVLKANTLLKNQFTNTHEDIFVDLINFFCNSKGCLTRIGDDKQAGITSWDYGHLTPIASNYLAKNLLLSIVSGAAKNQPQASATTH